MGSLPLENANEIEAGIVVVGGGIGGLATAVALHKKGISSIVLERSEALRTGGSAIGIYTNGWRALDELGVSEKLGNCTTIKSLRRISLDNGKQSHESFGEIEHRCMKRNDLIKVLADSLPPKTIQFGCHIVDMKLDPLTSDPIIRLQDGRVINAKVVIGCDGVNSVVSEFVGLKPANRFAIAGSQGLTYYPNGHGFSNEFVQVRKGPVLLGRLPVTDNLVNWFIARPWTSQDSRLSTDPKLIRQANMEALKDHPKEMVEMITNCEMDSLTLVQLKYRAPWDLLLGSFRKGTVTVAGDAMHAMGPFIGQGGASTLEDAVVLARNLAQEMSMGDGPRDVPKDGICAAIDRYVRERRMRILRLSTQTFLIGMLVEDSSPLTKIAAVLILLLFGNVVSHTHYDCGRL